MTGLNGAKQNKHMDVPSGRCVHLSPRRIRLRVKEKQGDEVYFGLVLQTLRAALPQAQVEVNPRTGSVLCIGLDSFEDLARTGLENNLFQVSALSQRMTPTRAIHQGLTEMNATIKRSSSGEIDLTSLVFLFLIGTGIYQLARGNLGLPPWYTAFWYAFSVCTKSVSEELNATEQAQGFEQ
jgi:hypothetical protein